MLVHAVTLPCPAIDLSHKAIGTFTNYGLVHKPGGYCLHLSSKAATELPL
jgi:hypothetical protein